MKICGIYKITNPQGKIYIGQSTHIRHRHWKYKNGKCKNQIKIHNSIEKYGWSAHKFEIIHLCQRSELNNLERYYIQLFNACSHGLNILEGGMGTLGRKLSDESKIKIGIAHKGKIVSEETKKRLSESLSGMPSWNKGKRLSQSHIENLKKALKGRKSACGMKGKKWTQQHRERFIKSNTGISRNKGKIAYQYSVVQMNVKGIEIKVWDSAKKAAIQLDLNPSLITSCCRNNRNKTGGFKWKYKNHPSQS